eukprot:763089-Hanusia_phi.AAC.4
MFAHEATFCCPHCSHLLTTCMRACYFLLIPRVCCFLCSFPTSSVWRIDAVTNISCTYAVLWAMEKQFEARRTCHIAPAFIFFCSLYYIAHFIQTRPHFLLCMVTRTVAGGEAGILWKRECEEEESEERKGRIEEESRRVSGQEQEGSREEEDALTCFGLRSILTA